MAQIHYIKDLYENEDLSLREIARRTQHSFSTVQKYAYQEDWSKDTLPNVAPEDYPILGAYIPYINEWMEADRKVPRKQRHTARRIYDRLCTENGYLLKLDLPEIRELIRLMKNLTNNVNLIAKTLHEHGSILATD
ncbi:MAG: hypothetical protein IKG87_15295 [Clostridia bacterium]|nr:hypothetical protein [Clostridia bacterium]